MGFWVQIYASTSANCIPYICNHTNVPHSTVHKPIPGNTHTHTHIPHLCVCVCICKLVWCAQQLNFTRNVATHTQTHEITSQYGPLTVQDNIYGLCVPYVHILIRNHNKRPWTEPESINGFQHLCRMHLEPYSTPGVGLPAFTSGLNLFLEGQSNAKIFEFSKFSMICQSFKYIMFKVFIYQKKY